jgi:hypothetical protein
MTDPAPNPSIPGVNPDLSMGRPAAVSFGISLAVHAAIAATALLVVWTVTMPTREDRPDVTVSFFDPAPSGVVLTQAEDTPLAAVLPAEAAKPPSEELRPETRVAEPTLSEKVAANAPGTDSPAAVPAGATLSASPEDRRALIESTAFPEVRFAGLGAGNARSLIYVVDAGGSMVTTFARVKDDLKRSLFKTVPSQQVQVVFFTKGGRIAAPHPADAGDAIRPIRMIRATRENIRAISAWIDGVRPAGTGNPIPALETALQLKPDAVFVLSSVIPGMGEWKPDKAAVLASLERLNPVGEGGKRAVVIKTIQYLDADPQGILQAIAEAHGGKDGYNFIRRTE